MSEIVMSFEQALGTVLHHAAAERERARVVERVGLLDAVGRVLAEEVRAERDQPPFDRATRDGFAVRAADAGGSLRIAGAVRAGEMWRGEALRGGEAVEIMTGAPMPEGADAVVMVEHVSVDGETVRVHEGRAVRAGENFVPRGAEARAGDVLLPVGRVVEAPEVALAASCGCAELTVFARPRVAIVATGDELVELDARPEAWEIRNSNSYALAAMVRGEGGAAERMAIARDVVDDLRERVGRGRESDLLLLSGGVSMGKYDLVEQVLREAGAEFFFTGALIQPGKPVVFGRLPRRENDPTAWTYFFGLPGNPVSTEVCFRLFVAPMLRAIAGRTQIAPMFVEATLAEDVKGGARVTRFLPAVLESAWDAVSVRVVGWQGSGDLAANARAGCYAVLPKDEPSFVRGRTVRVLLR